MRNRSRKRSPLRGVEDCLDDANTLTDDEVLAVARNAEALAHIMIDLALLDVRIQ